MIHNYPADQVNAEYDANIQSYLNGSVSPCDRKRSIALLRQFARKDFLTFWEESVNKYLPAVREGTMKLAEQVYSHDEAIRYAKEQIKALDVKELARGFLYGVAHNAPEYRTALACYYYVKNLPDHAFERKHVGSSCAGEVYSETTCEICNYNSQLSKEPKMHFWHINVDMEHFYLKGRIPFCFHLNTAIVYLEEYKSLSRPDCAPEDLEHFQRILAFIEALPERTTPSNLRTELKNSGLLKMTLEQIGDFINMLGYLNILHTEDSFGVTAGHTNEKDMLDPMDDRSYFAHPVHRWTRKNGIDYGEVKRLFGDLYGA